MVRISTTAYRNAK